MKWQEEYKINIPAIDSQHKRLFELIGELNEAIRTGLKGSHVEKLLVALDQYKTRHFQLEEKYMKECNYPGLEEQQEAHSFFMKRFAELSEELAEKGLTPGIVQAIKGELTKWVKEHVTGLDKDFGDYYIHHSK